MVFPDARQLNCYKTDDGIELTQMTQDGTRNEIKIPWPMVEELVDVLTAAMENEWVADPE